MPEVAMSPEHKRLFLDAARLYDVTILVRRTNLMSLRFIGAMDCVPKRLDCKAKTANLPYATAQSGQIDCAGLVVDPTVTGPAAFESDKKFHKALDIWSSFAQAQINPKVATWEGQQDYVYIPGGQQYFVDLKPGRPRYGCLKLTTSGLLTAGKYIHGDFDLYGIVPASDPGRNIAVFEERLGYPHSRSPEFLDVQTYVNARAGAPMILHGAQESYSDEHGDEQVDIFYADGTVGYAGSGDEIAWLYNTTFEGRRLFTRDGPKIVVRGGYMIPG